MSAERLAVVGRALADPTRARMLTAMLDGRAWTVTELATATGVGASTTSEHLTMLTAAELLIEHRQGRHRYVQLADERVAELLESLATIGPSSPVPSANLRAASTSRALARGRTCYDHLAGRLGVAVTDALIGRGLLDQTLTLTGEGREWFDQALGTPLVPGRRKVTRSCIDWTERRPHLAGAAGAHLCASFLANSWVRRIGSNRAVDLTSAGNLALERLLGVPVNSFDLLS